MKQFFNILLEEPYCSNKFMDAQKKISEHAQQDDSFIYDFFDAKLIDDTVIHIIAPYSYKFQNQIIDVICNYQNDPRAAIYAIGTLHCCKLSDYSRQILEKLLEEIYRSKDYSVYYELKHTLKELK